MNYGSQVVRPPDDRKKEGKKETNKERRKDTNKQTKQTEIRDAEEPCHLGRDAEKWTIEKYGGERG